MKFGDRLKNLREENNMSRDNLANKLNISYSAVSKYETNIRFPDQEMLKKISDIFNVSIDYLLGNTDQRNISIDEKYKEVYDVEEAMEVILSQPGLMLNGELLSDESKIILANSILNGIRTVKELESKKNKQNKKSDNNEQRN